MEKRKIATIIVTAYLLFLGFFIEPNSLAVKKYEVHNQYLAGARIVFLSDFHLKKNRHDRNRINKIIKLTKEQKPNLILVGGDYLQGKEFDDSTMGILAAKLSLIGVPVFAVLGESDWQIDGKKISAKLLTSGISVLENSNKKVVLNRRNVDIAGISDIKSRQPNIDRALSRTQKLKIVITHNPDIYYDILDDVAIIFAGHTHGGQIVIPFTPALFVDSKFGSKLASGMVKETNNTMIVSKGIGTTGFPIRLNCKPEIVVVDFIK